MPIRNKRITFDVTKKELYALGEFIHSHKDAKNKTLVLLETLGVEPCFSLQNCYWNYEDLFAEMSNGNQTRLYCVAFAVTQREKDLIVERLQDFKGSTMRERVFDALGLSSTLEHGTRQNPTSIFFGESAKKPRRKKV